MHSGFHMLNQILSQKFLQTIASSWKNASCLYLEDFRLYNSEANKSSGGIKNDPLPSTTQRRFSRYFCTPEPSGSTRSAADFVILPRFSMDSYLSPELLSDLKSSYVLFSPLKSAKISLESIFSLHYRIEK